MPPLRIGLSLRNLVTILVIGRFFLEESGRPWDTDDEALVSPHRHTGGASRPIGPDVGELAAVVRTLLGAGY